MLRPDSGRYSAAVEVSVADDLHFGRATCHWYDGLQVTTGLTVGYQRVFDASFHKSC